MKHIFRLMAVAALSAAVVSGCSKREVMVGNGNTDPFGNAVGYIRVAEGGLTVEFDGERIDNHGQGSGSTRAYEETTPVEGLDVNTFWVEFVSAETGSPVDYAVGEDASNKAARHKYSDVRGQLIELPLGDFTMRAYSADSYEQTPGVYWKGSGQPSWAGDSEPFTIASTNTTENPVTNVAVNCLLQSAKVTVEMEHSLAAHIPGGATVEVVMLAPGDSDDDGLKAIYENSGDHLYGLKQFTLTEAGLFNQAEPTEDDRPSAASYFVPKSAGSNSMDVNVSGTYVADGGDSVPLDVTIPIVTGEDSVEPGQWRKVWLYLETTDAPEGSIIIRATIETWVYDQKIDVDVAEAMASLGGEPVIKDSDASKLGLYSLGGLKLDGTVNEVSAFNSAGKYTGNARVGLNLNTGVAEVSKFDIKVASTNSDLASELKSIEINDWTDVGTVSGIAKTRYFTPWGFPTELPTESVVYDLAPFLEDMYANYTSGTHTVSFAVESGDYYYNAELKLTVSGGGSGEEPSGDITITWLGHDDLSKEYKITDDLECKIHVEAPNGIAKLMGTLGGALAEDIQSQDLMPLTFDLCDPEAYKEGLSQALNQFNIPNGDAVKGQTSVDVDITDFLLIFPEGSSEFSLEVTDNAGGTASATIKLKN